MDQGGGSRIANAVSKMTWICVAFYTSGYTDTPTIVGLPMESPYYTSILAWLAFMSLANWGTFASSSRTNCIFGAIFASLRSKDLLN